MMGQFDAIRPYNDNEVPAVLARLFADPEFLSTLARFKFPRLVGPFGWLIKPLISMGLRKEFAQIKDVKSLQQRVEPYVDRTIERATDGISVSGLEQLSRNKRYLFLANHRDIVMDPAFVNYAIYQSGLPTPRIAIGDNLLQKPYVSDLMRLNKSFIVHRSQTRRRDKLATYQLLSEYINYSINDEGESIWIAQAEGRAKDGNDRTDSAILKMFHMARKNEDFALVIDTLNLIPVSISYEYDPCDLAKARELYIRANTGHYEKTPGEDDASIALGITGYKGRVHLHFGEKPALCENAKLLAPEIDRQILSNYRLFPVHYLAYKQWADADPLISVPAAQELFSASEVASAEQQWQRRLESCPVEHRPYLIMQYAMPVLNQYRLKLAH